MQACRATADPSSYMFPLVLCSFTCVSVRKPLPSLSAQTGRTPLPPLTLVPSPRSTPAAAAAAAARTYRHADWQDSPGLCRPPPARPCRAPGGRPPTDPSTSQQDRPGKRQQAQGFTLPQPCRARRWCLPWCFCRCLTTCRPSGMHSAAQE